MQTFTKNKQEVKYLRGKRKGSYCNDNIRARKLANADVFSIS